MSWDKIAPAPLILISGSEQFLARRARSTLIQRVREADPEVEITDREAGAYAAGEIATLVSPSLFGEARVVFFSGVESCNDAFLADALDYTAEPSEDTVVVFQHGGGNRGRKLLDALRTAQVQIIDAQPLKRDAERAEFASAEFARAQRAITDDALAALMDAIGSDLGELAAGCRQLIDDTEGRIDRETVNAYHRGRVEVTGFAVADTAVAGRTAQALVQLRQALGSGVDPVPLVAAMAQKIRAMARLSGLRGSSGQLAGILGLAPWQVDRARRDASRWSPEGFGDALCAVSAADLAVKGGSRDPVYALETMVIAIGEAARRR